MDLPIRSRLFVSASNNKTKVSSTASACLSNPKELNSGRSCSSERRPIAAPAVQVRSHDGWGLPLTQNNQLQNQFKKKWQVIWKLEMQKSKRKCSTIKRIKIKPKIKQTLLHRKRQNLFLSSYRSLCIAEVPVAREIQGKSPSPQTDTPWSCTRNTHVKNYQKSIEFLLLKLLKVIPKSIW